MNKTRASFIVLVLAFSIGLVHAKSQFSATPQEIRVTLKRAIQAIESTHNDGYDGEGYLRELEALDAEDLDGHLALQRRALLANPALDFDDLLIIERHFGKNASRATNTALGLPGGNFNSLWQSKRNGWNTTIVRLENVFSDADRKRVALYSPEHGGLVTDIDPHFDGEKIVFAMARPKDFAYRLYEMSLSGGEPAQIDPDSGADVDHFDPCYLPDGAIIFGSTATYLGMPCINGQPRMASLYRLSADRQNIRQLGFDQDTSWYPTLMHDGRVMYTRWDYSDMQHSNNRPLMVMNPDGSGQRSIAFSNSQFPASFFFARPIPGHPSQIIGTITGHHGPARVGRLILTDPAISGYEEKGMVQEIPGHGKKVERVVSDPLMHDVWPRFLHPYPLAQRGTNLGGGEYFLVSMKPDPNSVWGIYLVDVYDNAVLLWEDKAHGFFEPLPIMPRKAPPVIPQMVDPESDIATLYIQDIYQGPAMKDVPRGTVKNLLVGSYQFSANGNGGHPGTIGVDSGWDIKTIIGVTPVNADGSVTAEIPSKTPLFFQPMDSEGRAIQGMRTWASAQGGEMMSCVGCHESSSEMPRPVATMASLQSPEPLQDWLGPERPMSFSHEIQPILDAKCVSCHDGQPANGRYSTHRPEFAEGIPDLRPTPTTDYMNRTGGTAHPSYGGQFTESYMALHSLTRHRGIESPMHVLNPGEFGSIVSELAQILKKGHHGVELSDEEWLRLNTWMDYNAPFHGYRVNIVDNGRYEKGKNMVLTAFQRGNELSQKYACQDNFKHTTPPPLPLVATQPAPDQATLRKQRATQTKAFLASMDPARVEPLRVELGGGHELIFAAIPAGSFVMGAATESPAELPMHEVTIDEPFWMATTEITNAQLRIFKADHDSLFEDRLNMQFGQEGVPVNGDELPAVRVSWTTAMEFCEWLSEKSGHKVTLPSEAQWEWAARAGGEGAFWFGGLDADFGKYANLGDKSLELFAENTATGSPRYTAITPVPDPTRHEMWIPYIKSVVDGQRMQCAPGSFEANPWGLYDIHGNVAEWTRSEARPYPFVDAAATGADDPHTRRVVRGGSYRDRPYRATASYRLDYAAWQKVHDVGFRVVIERK